MGLSRDAGIGQFTAIDICDDCGEVAVGGAGNDFALIIIKSLTTWDIQGLYKFDSTNMVSPQGGVTLSYLGDLKL